MVKENIDRERPTQGGENGRIVGLSRGMGVSLAKSSSITISGSFL